MSHSFYMTMPFTLFLYPIIPIISSGSYNLWSYTLCSFIQFPITSSYKSLRSHQHHTVLKPSLQTFFNITPTFMKILHTHTHTHTHTFSYQQSCFQNTGRTTKYFQVVASINQIHFLSTSSFCNFYSSMPIANYFKFTTLPKCQTMYHLGHVVLWCDIPIVLPEHIIAAEIFPVNAQLHCSSYKWQLHIPATK